MSSERKGIVNFLQEFSIPLIAGVFVALAVANLFPEAYHHIVDGELTHATIFGHHITLHFLVNDIFMVLFFGIAAKEIVEAALPGGSLNPIRKAMNPLMGTVGGVVGPVGVFFAIIMLTSSMYPAEQAELTGRGWGIPTATDIALAWLVARTVFGRGHPAINFLLLLAVADDAIGLVIIAVFYGDPSHPAHPEYLGLVAAAMALAFAMRKMGVKTWVPYIVFAGPLAWGGLILANLHPALALVFVVPFLPGPKRDTGMFNEQDEAAQALAAGHAAESSALHEFEHQLKLFVDFGLFFFAFANAGVEFAGIGPMTWTILASLIVGKTVGITLLSVLADKIGLSLPDGMGIKELIVAGFIAALGLTVALFVAAAAFPMNAELLGQAKMGALFSGFVGLAALLRGKTLGLGGTRVPEAQASSSKAAPEETRTRQAG